jgi:hypothetical protein
MTILDVHTTTTDSNTNRHGIVSHYTRHAREVVIDQAELTNLKSKLTDETRFKLETKGYKLDSHFTP